MKKILLLFCILLPQIIFAQEVFVDKTTGQECLFLGSLSLEGDKAKVLEDGQIRWKELCLIEQTRRLSLPEFLDEIFACNLQFELSSSEPFWHATITKDKLTHLDVETGEYTIYQIRITNSHTLSDDMYFMFSTSNGETFGLIYSVGLTKPQKQRCCEYDIPADENRLYCSFLSIGRRAYKGSATIIEISHNLQTDSSVEGAPVFTVGYADDNAKLHQLKMVSITEQEYLTCSTAYNKLRRGDIKETKDQFFLDVNGKELTFQKEGNMEVREVGELWYEYHGYYPDLRLHAILAISVSDELITFADFILLDPETGGQYILLPRGDYFEPLPLLSPNNQYFLDYSNSYQSGYIRLFKINSKENPATYIVRYADSDDGYPFFIESMVWKTDSVIFLKAYKDMADAYRNKGIVKLL
jgi:hypothetical protein